METLPSDAESPPSSARSFSSNANRQPKPRLISASLMLTEHREISGIDLELIEMRYQQMLALMNLETLFAEGQLDCP